MLGGADLTSRRRTAHLRRPSHLGSTVLLVAPAVTDGTIAAVRVGRVVVCVAQDHPGLGSARMASATGAH